MRIDNCLISLIAIFFLSMNFKQFKKIQIYRENLKVITSLFARDKR